MREVLDRGFRTYQTEHELLGSKLQIARRRATRSADATRAGGEERLSHTKTPNNKFRILCTARRGKVRDSHLGELGSEHVPRHERPKDQAVAQGLVHYLKHLRHITYIAMLL